MKSILRALLPFSLPALLLAAAPAAGLRAQDEPLPAQRHKELGRMWTFEHVPLDLFEREYGFRPSQEWLDHLRLSALRFGGGCSASFVSPRGLILTNHHCARDNVASASPPDADWLRDGFFASSLEDEKPLPGLTVQQLVAVEDVTAALKEGVRPEDDAATRADRIRQNREAILDLARAEWPGHEPEIVEMYHGGVASLYVYKVYDDIRLVATPQLQMAKFGGDPDNFTYPRWALDFSLVRAWEHGKPADTSAHYLGWSQDGPQEGDPVFVVGNPGSTGRLSTLSQMEYLRDVEYPGILSQIERILAQLRAMARDNDDPELETQILNMENSRKAFQGFLDGLRNDRILAIKRAAEEDFRARIEADPELQERYGPVFDRLDEISREKSRLVQNGGSRGDFRRLQQEEEDLVSRIGEAFFEVYGTAVPPDATFTLRISDGVVKSYPYNGTIAPWKTTLFGLYDRHYSFDGQPPWDLPSNWLDAMDRMDLSTPYNLVSTCDIIGGNSGSPMVNAAGEIVGLVFDGNIESLGNRFVYTDEVARTVCVHPAIITEALRHVYGAAAIAEELEGSGPGYE